MASAKGNQEKQPKFKRINKYYWLNMGYEMVDGALGRVHKQIESVNTYINGLLGIYVLATVIDAIYTEIDTVLMLIVILAPVVIVKIAAFYAKISVIPEAKSFFPDSAQSSEATYYQFLRDARAHLKTLKKFAAWSTGILLIVLAVVTWLTVVSKQESAEKKDELTKVKKELASAKKSLDSIKKLDIYSLNAKFLKEEKKLLLEGTFPAGKHVNVQLTKKDDQPLLPLKQLLIGSSNKLYYDMDLTSIKQNMDAIQVKVTYQVDKNELRFIKKTISLKD